MYAVGDLLHILDGELGKVFNKLGYDADLAVFQYSDRPDISDFQTNSSMVLAKKLKKSPLEIARAIAGELERCGLFESISIDGPGFLNVSIRDSVLLEVVNGTRDDPKCGFKNNAPQKTVVIDFGGYNIAKEPHVGHLRSTVIGESVRRIYEFCGDRVIGDVHQGDWGLNMGMVIQGIRLKYPNLKCFSDGFNGDVIDDLKTNSEELTEIYRLATARAKDDSIFKEEVHRATKMLQDGFKPYRVLWKHFTDISIRDLEELAVGVFGAHFDLWNGESSVHELIVQMIRNLTLNGIVTVSNGAKIIDLKDMDPDMPPVIIEKSDGAVMYASSDIATILDRLQKFNPDLMLYIVDARQSLHFKQVFLACKKIGLLNERHVAEHCPFGTMNGADGKPFKTRSGDTVRLRELVDEMEARIREKSTQGDENDIRNIAVACIKFADLINYRESNYVFDFEQFTNYEGKTGAYILYSVVRINSILSKYDLASRVIDRINSSEEKSLLMEFTRFSSVIEQAYARKVPNVVADYVYRLAKKFSAFYAKCSIDNEDDRGYQRSKISLLGLTKQYIEKCLYILGIDTVERM
ncbi:MAG: arginine--tRNA ligase [Rickettsiales bacterium]|jgi:arginyl-tRNA synthetase|nr:arginine--tRNA ligase [Rickettsiales bacterium]